MSIAPGSRLGTYEIVAAIGAGGMGEVYRARDTRLDRTVAIKVLPPSVRGDAALKARFHREAQLISSLNDPHICALYDVGEQDGVDFLVMEHVEGQTLAARLAKGPLRRDEALRHAVDIASALASAHRQGIVHRDLKPGNVMLTKAGAKLLDFGLAKLRTADVVSLEAGGSIVTAEQHGMTSAGTILGTLHYMSPEQLEGKESDPRSDIFAFGVVLYEMTTGRRAFGGDSPAAIIAAILETEPAPISKVRGRADPSLERLIRRCLAKDPEHRWQTAYDLARELEWVAGAESSAATLPASRRRAPAWAIATVLTLLAGATLAWILAGGRAAPVAGAAMQFAIHPPEGTAFGTGTLDRVPSFAVSPDGRMLAFVATDRAGRRAIWIRSLASLSAETLAGTEGALFPFWSADSAAIGFFAQGKLKRVSLSGGAAVALADAPAAEGGTWNQTGVILFAPGEGQPLHRIAETGGAATAVTSLEPGAPNRRHSWPQFLPDGRHFIYWARGRPAPGSFYLGSLDSATKRLLDETFMATYASPGYLLFVRDGALLARRFDLTRQEVSGEPVTVSESVAFSSTNARASFSASNNGVLAYRSSGLLAGNSLVWVDRSGKTTGSVGPAGDFQTSRLSPDGGRLAAELHDLRTGLGDLWVLDLKRGSTSRVTFAGIHENNAVWSPDGERFVFAARPDGLSNVHVKSWNSSEPDEALLPSGPARIPTDWSADGRHILFEQTDPKTRTDVWVLRMPERQPSPYVATDFVERDARFSPDGRWIAYVSNESGREEVYVRSFPASNSRWTVSVQGGTAPRWRGDGKELFYISGDRMLMAVSTQTAARFEAGVPTPLFKAAIRDNRDYNVSSDGQRFLLNPAPAGPEAVLPIVVIANWPSLLVK